MPALKPTLWRTCRALANRRRLRMIALLLKQPGQSVTEVARALRLSRPSASQYLRALEARGILAARRSGVHVYYRVRTADTGGPAQAVVHGLRLAFRQYRDPGKRVFKAATAFTHPRRAIIYRALADGATSRGQLRAVTGIPRIALVRHLGKLIARGFVTRPGTDYRRVSRRDELGRALAAWASES